MSKEKVKNEYNRGKQRYLCKECGRNYTGTKNGYPESTKREALKYYKVFREHIKKDITYRVKKYASDRYEAYHLIDPRKRLIRKAHTSTVEKMNRLLRHYLARFRRKTYCWSKSLSMINDSVLIFMHRKSISYIHL